MECRFRDLHIIEVSSRRIYVGLLPGTVPTTSKRFPLFAWTQLLPTKESKWSRLGSFSY